MSSLTLVKHLYIHHETSHALLHIENACTFQLLQLNQDKKPLFPSCLVPSVCMHSVYPFHCPLPAVHDDDVCPSLCILNVDKIEWTRHQRAKERVSFSLSFSLTLPMVDRSDWNGGTKFRVLRTNYCLLEALSNLVLFFFFFLLLTVTPTCIIHVLYEHRQRATLPRTWHMYFVQRNHLA